MENIIPALLTLHIYGIILWVGGMVTQYLFFGSLKSENGVDRLMIELIRKTYCYMIWPGIALILASGLAVMMMFGMEWFSPRGFIHIKIFVAIILIILTHLGWSKLKIINRISIKSENESDDNILLDQSLRKWKNIMIFTLIGMGCIILLGVYKFGF